MGLAGRRCHPDNFRLVEAYEVIVTDDLGNEVRLAGAAGKIVSLAPHLTERF